VTVDIADELRRRFADYDDAPVSVEEWRVLLKREGYVINHKKLFRALPGRKACGGEGNGASL
jgi:hypothetical protein